MSSISRRHKIVGVITVMAVVALCVFVILSRSAQLENNRCTLSIYTDESTVLEPTEVSFSTGQSVLDILKKVTRDASIQMEYSGSGVMAYVKGIDNVYEFDKGPKSGWVYTVNGVECAESAGAVKPGEGDVIVWRYSIDH